MTSEITHSDAAIIEYLNTRRGKIISHTGGWFPGKGVFSHGYSMLEELVGHKTYMQILVLNATGKMISPVLASWIEGIYGCLSWPDPRIWCNQIGALAGSARTSVVSATVMGVLASDSRSYGVFPLVEGVNFIQGAMAQHTNGLSATDIVSHAAAANKGKPFIMGYYRPIAKGDERLEVMEKLAQQLNMPVGKHLALAYEVEQVLFSRYEEGMNINGYISAVLSDYEFSAQEVYRLFSTLVASGVTACYLDTYQSPADSFLPLRCDDIHYQGPSRREIPDD